VIDPEYYEEVILHERGMLRKVLLIWADSLKEVERPVDPEEFRNTVEEHLAAHKSYLGEGSTFHQVSDELKGSEVGDNDQVFCIRTHEVMSGRSFKVEHPDHSGDRCVVISKQENPTNRRIIPAEFERRYGIASEREAELHFQPESICMQGCRFCLAETHGWDIGGLPYNKKPEKSPP